MSTLGQIHQLNHVHQLVELLGDLLHLAVIPHRGQGEPGEGCILGGCDVEGFDVVTALGEQAHHAGQGTGLVFKQH